MKRVVTQLLAWSAFGVIVLISLAAALLSARNAQQGSATSPWFAYLVGPTFALVGALILARRPDNRVGWLLMLPGASAFVLTDALLQPLIDGTSSLPSALTPGLWLTLWYSNWSWALLIFPLMWLMVLFPTGRAIGRSWGWLNWVGIALLLFLALGAAFADSLAPGSGEASWSYPNPIGFVAVDAVEENTIQTLMFAVMPVWVVLCLMALVVRYRRAGQVERQQMKWLLFATALFVASYVPVFILNDSWTFTTIFDYLWMVAMPLIPLAIGVAILRYRLYDIDVIIRKTVQYTGVSALLALIYFGSVVLLQGVFGTVVGESPLLIVASTLLIAALFNPVRRRVQDAVDRRFYRRKYDAQQVLAQFAQTCRDETDVGRLSAELTRTVQETLEPRFVTIWLTVERKR